MDTLTKVVGFRVSDKDYRTLEDYAKATGQSLSDFVRTQAFRMLGGERVMYLELPDGTKVDVDKLQKARFILYSGDPPFDLPDPEEIQTADK